MDNQRKKNDLPFGKILAEVMAQRSLTLGQVAHLAGVGKSVAHGWLNGAIPYDLKAVSKLAKALGMSFQGLLLAEDDEPIRAQTLGEMFEEVDHFDGLCKVTIKKLVPRRRES